MELSIHGCVFCIILFFLSGKCLSKTPPYGGTVVYSCLDYYPGYRYCANTNGIEITVLRFIVIPHISIIEIYRSPAWSIEQLCAALQGILDSLQTEVNLFIGDFNINWFNIDETVSVLGSFLYINCSDCGEINVCRTNKTHRIQSQSGRPVFDVVVTDISWCTCGCFPCFCFLYNLQYADRVFFFSFYLYRNIACRNRPDTPELFIVIAEHTCCKEKHFESKREGGR